MSSIRKALALSISQRFLSFAIQITSAMILARLITPAQAGIFSLAVGLVAIAQMFRDFGVGEYLVQEKHLDQSSLQAAFSIALALGWSLGLLLILIAVPIAHFYRELIVADVIRILSINFFLVPFGYVANAMLTRELRFDALLIVQTASAIIGAVASIVLVWAGFGAIGLAWALVAGMVANIVALSFICPSQMVYRPSCSGWSRIGHFGAYKTSSFLLEQVMRRAPDFFISRTLGFTASGLYSRANGLAETFGDFLVSAVDRVALPAFAKRRNENRPLGEAYIYANRLFACLPLSFFSFTAVFADPIIHLMFGYQWGGAVVAMRWLAISAMIMTPTMLAAPVLTANGAITNLVKAQLIANPIQIILIAVASFDSIEAVAASLVLNSVLRLALMHRAMYHVAQVSAREMFVAVAPGLTVAALALIAPALFLWWANVEKLPDLLICLCGSILYTACWLTSLYVMHHPYRSEIGKLVARVRAPKGSAH